MEGKEAGFLEGDGANAAHGVARGVPPCAVGELGNEVDGRDTGFFEGDVVVQIGGIDDFPPAGGKAECFYAFFKEGEKLRCGVVKGYADVFVFGTNHVEVDLVEGETGAAPGNVVCRAVEAVLLCHVGAKGFFAVEEDEFDALGQLRLCGKDAGCFQQHGGCTGTVICAYKGGGNAYFRVDMAGVLVKNDKDKKGTIALWQKIRKFLDEEFPDKLLDANLQLIHKNERGCTTRRNHYCTTVFIKMQ